MNNKDLIDGFSPPLEGEGLFVNGIPLGYTESLNDWVERNQDILEKIYQIKLGSNS